MLVFAAAVSVALVFSFLCSIFESVLLSIGHARVENLARDGSKAGMLLKRFKRDIDTPIAAILIVNTIAHTVGASVAGASYANVFDPQTLWIFTIVFTLAVLLFTEIIPKTMGVTFAARLARPVAWGIYIFTLALKPRVALSGMQSRALRGKSETAMTSVEEIRLLAMLGRHEGSVSMDVASMIVGATHLSQLRAVDVMVPRASVKILSGEQNRGELLTTIRRTRYSRFPYSPTGDLDQVSGLVLSKELLLHLHDREGESVDWSVLLRDPLIVPDSKPVHALLRTFQENQTHMALVVDEYGTFRGIVTNEDLLEEIVGEIYDESDRPRKDLRRRDDGSLEVRGTIDLRKVCHRLGLDWSPDLHLVTLGGLIVAELGQLPVAGDAISWRGYRFEVIEASERRAERIRIRKEESAD